MRKFIVVFMLMASFLGSSLVLADGVSYPRLPTITHQSN